VRGLDSKRECGAARLVSMGPAGLLSEGEPPPVFGVIIRLADNNAAGPNYDRYPPPPGKDLYSMTRNRLARGELAGFDVAQFPPAFEANPESHGYLPRRATFNGSHYGSPEALLALNGELLASGIAPAGDLVVNHLVGDRHSEFQHGPYTFKPTHTLGGRRAGKHRFGSDAVYRSRGGTGIRERKSSPDALEFVKGPAELVHEDPKVRAAVGDMWIARLAAAGVALARFDFAHGLDSEAILHYVRTHGIAGVSEHFYGCHATLHDPQRNLYRPDPHRELLSRKARASGTLTYDFTTMWALREALKSVSTGANGESDVDRERSDFRHLVDPRRRPAGLIGIDAAHAVLVVDNHDTGPSTNRFNETHDKAHGQQHWPMPGWAVGLAYAYALTHPAAGVEVYAPHMFDWMSHGAGPHKGKRMGEEIRALMRLRKDAGISPTSEIGILHANKGLYVARIVGSHQTLYVKLGWDSWSPSADSYFGTTLRADGLHYAVWSTPAQTPDTALASFATKLH